MNALDELPDAARGVLSMFRASYFVSDPPRFLAQARRVLRPGGLAVIDWLPGVSDAAVLGLRGDEGHGGAPTPRIATSCDPQFPREGRHLIGPELMEQQFKVFFRDARYFYRRVRKFNLFLMTVLSPVGK